MAIFGDVGNQNSCVSSKRPPGTVRAFFLGSEQNRLLHWTVDPAPQAYGVRVPGYPPYLHKLKYAGFKFFQDLLPRGSIF